MRLILLLPIVFVITSCKQSRKIPDNFDYGKIENNVYKNDFFGFQLPVPASWKVQSKEEIEDMNRRTEKMFDKTSKDFREKIKVSEVNSARLLTVFKYSHDDTLVKEFNSSFAVLAENLKGATGVKDGEDYLRSVKGLMQESKLPYDYSNEFQKVKLGNKEFSMLSVKIHNEKADIQQYYYAIVMNGFAFCVISSAGNEEQEKELEDVLQKIHFD